ncbi:MAG: outer membrane beta-barrel protein [Tepidamorphaceae bacterium]
MKKFALTCLLGIALCGNAAADEMFGGATHDWSGHFIGLQAGGAWGESDGITIEAAPETFGPFDINGGFIGWTSGANWQNGAWVWGYESDTSFANISGSSSTCSPDCYGEVNWFSTVRGRLGYAHGMFLFYGTAGVAYGEIESGIKAPGSYSDDIGVGLAIGGGVEMAFDENWSAKIEYLHLDLGDNTAPAGAIVSTKTDFDDINIVRVGVKRKFDLWGMLTGK